MPSRNKRIPQSAASVRTVSKNPIAQTIDYANSYPCWRISNFDKDGPWGLDALLKFTFNYRENTYQAVSNSGIQAIDDALEQLKGKQINNREEFWEKVKSHCNCAIPVDVVERIEEEIISNTFVEKIYPKLLQFEKITWDEVRLQSHRSGNSMKSNNHNIDIDELIPEAQNRLKILRYNDRDKIYSLRLEGEIRIYGFKELNYLDIIWIDLEHKICPSRRK